MEGKNLGGRPTEYGERILELARQYRDAFFLPEDQRKDILGDEEVIPTKEGLALFIGISRETIYEWSSQDTKQEFSDIVNEIFSNQAKTLINKGLSGKFTPAITKVMLSKHGYREGIENMGKDGKDLIPENTLSKEETEQLKALLK